MTNYRWKDNTLTFGCQLVCQLSFYTCTSSKQYIYQQLVRSILKRIKRILDALSLKFYYGIDQLIFRISPFLPRKVDFFLIFKMFNLFRFFVSVSKHRKIISEGSFKSPLIWFHSVFIQLCFHMLFQKDARHKLVKVTNCNNHNANLIE